MYVRYFMTTSLVTVSQDTTLGEASNLMEEHDIRHLPVVDDEEKLLGMVSDRDIRSAFPSTIVDSDDLQEKIDRVQKVTVSEIMTTKTMVLRYMSTLDDAMLYFEKRMIGAMPVLDNSGKVIGILSFKDLMRAWRETFGLGGKGTFLIALEMKSIDQPLTPLVKALEASGIPFNRIILHEGMGDDPPMIYLKVKTYNIISCYSAIEQAGFAVHVPDEQYDEDD